MTETTSRSTPKSAGPRKSLFGGNAAPRGPVVRVDPPLTINLVSVGFLVMVVAMVGRALLLLGFTPQLRHYVVYANDHAKKPTKPFTATDIDNAVHSLRSGGLIQAAIFGVALLLLAYAMRRTRSASGSRWAVLIIFVYTMLPLYVVPTKNLPAITQVFGVVLGLASIAVLLLIFVPPASQKYFRECRAANLPPGAEPRPGLGSLFKPRPRPTAGSAATTKPTVNRRPAATRSADEPVSMSKSKAKVRSDADAVARGADLARSRAKASKSRRTPQ